MFIPCKETILDMTPTEFEKHSLRVLTEQLQNIENCIFQHDKIIEVDDGNYQIDGYIEEVINEMGQYDLSKYHITTIYIGGGTPSFINEKYITKLLQELQKRLENRVDKPSPAEIKLRLNRFDYEESKIGIYDYVIKNDNLEKTLSIIETIIAWSHIAFAGIPALLSFVSFFGHNSGLEPRMKALIGE